MTHPAAGHRLRDVVAACALGRFGRADPSDTSDAARRILPQLARAGGVFRPIRRAEIG